MINQKRGAFTLFFHIFAPKYEQKHRKNMFGLGMQEILIIALIVLLFFGGKKIPELMKGLGKGVKSFKEGMNEVNEVLEEPGKTTDIKNEKSQIKKDE